MIKKAVFYFALCLGLSGCLDQIQPSKKKSVKDDSILLLNVQGLITSEQSEAFMEYARNHAGKDKIKGVLVRVNSPGGSVAASQEINSTIRDMREFYKKPVFVSGGDTVASGALYSIMSADKIFVNEGTLFGSIGVLMTFYNFGELARWAKVEVYDLKAGEFKDSGSAYRKMTLRERELFENLMETAHDQFKEAIVAGRKLDAKAVESFSDGRIFSGREALEFGLADSLGAFNQAVRAIGEKTGLGSSPKLFDPGAKTAFEKIFESSSVKSFAFDRIFSSLRGFDRLAGRPLYILPSYISLQ